MPDFFKELRPASFRGIQFDLESDDKSFGRGIVTHKFVGRDQHAHEDMGAKVEGISLVAVVIGEGFVARADALEKAFAQKGPGTLIHPHYGEIQVVIIDGTRSHSSDAVGEVRFSITFERDDGPPLFPTALSNTMGGLLNASNNVFDALSLDFNKAFNISGLPDFVSSDALTRSASWLGKMNSIFSTSGLLPLLPSGIDTLDILSDGYASSAVSLYKTLRDLAAPKRTPVIGRAPVPVQVPSQTVAKALLKASDITVSDPITGSPSTAPVRLLNANAMDLYHRTMALSAAVGAVRHTSFESREEAISLRDGVTGRLEVLLDRLGEAEWDRSWSESRQMMAAIHRDIDDRIGRLPRTVQVRPAAVRSALALANRLYPDDTTQFLNKSADLVVRNRIRHPGFVPVQNLEVLVDAA